MAFSPLSDAILAPFSPSHGKFALFIYCNSFNAIFATIMAKPFALHGFFPCHASLASISHYRFSWSIFFWLKACCSQKRVVALSYCH
jgi:hypothetical protein